MGRYVTVGTDADRQPIDPCSRYRVRDHGRRLDVPMGEYGSQCDAKPIYRNALLPTRDRKAVLLRPPQLAASYIGLPSLLCKGRASVRSAKKRPQHGAGALR